MNLAELLVHLDRSQVQLRLDGDQLVFEGSRSAVTPEILEALRQHKPELVDLLRGDRSGEFPPPVERPDDPPLTGPLSFAQQRLWFLDRLEPQRSIYHINWALKLDGPLNEDALERSLREILRRHAVLRTTYDLVGEEPTQTVTSADRFRLDRVDLSHLAGDLREVEMWRRANEEFERPFDLSRDLMLRGGLLRLEPAGHLLVLVLHHIAMDGWSVRILRGELEELYDAYSRGEASPLPELSVQYLDFAVWQRRYLRGEVLEKQLDYWRGHLNGMPSLLELPLDHPRPPVQSFRGNRRSWTYPEDLALGLRRLGQGENCTMFMTLLAVFQSLLSRYTGSHDIFVASPIANRTRSDVEPLIGFFVNTLVLRVDLSGQPGFREVLRRVREVTLNAYSHQDLPFEKLVEELEPKRNLSHSPLAQAMFTLESSSWRPPRLTGLRVARCPTERHTAKFDLGLTLTELEGGLKGTLEYAKDLFKAETMDRFLGHFEQMMAAVLADPDCPINRLPLLTATERRQQLIEWNLTDAAYPREQTIPEVFEAVAARQPDAVALWDANRSMTYGELNERANQVAHRLRRLGVKPDMPVGLCVERSPEMVVAVLGILKAGGAYTPLDPAYPAERLTFLLADSGAQVWVTERRCQDLPAWSSVTRLVLDREQEELQRESCSNPRSTTSSTQLAYLNYTSGSTGVPKAVGVPHRAVLRLVFGNDYAQLDPSCVTVHLSPISFDASTFELWGSLLHGGQCVLHPAGVPTIEGLAPLVRDRGVTALWLTTSLFNSLTDQGLEPLAGLGELLVGGEALSVGHVRRAQQCLPRTCIVNCYGPTEATTFTTCHRIPPLTPADTSVPIGRPLANTRVHVLDSHGQPVPVGVSGELFIGGDGLARGYLGRPDLTAERFVPDPFGADSGGRLYRTGDLVRWLPDGSLDFLGRDDDQVKIRGFRVELGEIEAILRRHPQVRQAVVFVRDAPTTGRHLVAGVVPGSPDLTPSRLQEHCRACLPSHACPGSWILLDRLPIGANGKADRRALLTTAGSQSGDLIGGEQPRDMTEWKLVSLWRQVLDQPTLGVHDNFFTSGGHSLLAVRLFSSIEQEFGRRLPLATLFEAPTAAQMAARLRDKGWKPSWSCLVGLRTKGERKPVFLVHALGGNVLNYDSLTQHLDSDQPIYALQAVGLDGQQTPFARVEEMAAFYIAEIRKVQPRGPYVLGGASFGGLVAYEMAQQLIESGESPGLLLLLDSGPVERLIKRWAAEGANATPEALGGRMHRHLSEFGRLTWPGRQTYLREGWKRFIERQERRRRHQRYLAHRDRGEPMQDLGAYQGEYVRACHEAAAHRYRFRPYLGDVVLFLAEDRSASQNQQMVEEWRRLVTRSLTIIPVPGDHATMMQEPQVRVLAARMSERLERPPGHPAASALNPSQPRPREQSACH